MMDLVRVAQSNKIEIGDFLLKDFLNFLDASEKTAATYQRALKQFFKFLKDNGIKTPCHDDIVTFKKSLLDAGRKATTVALYLASVRKLFSWLEQRNQYPDVSRGVKSPRIDAGHKKDFLGANQLKKILSNMPRNTVQQKRDYAMFLLAVTGGLRTIEISRADLRDMRMQGDCWILGIMGKGKSSKSDFIKLAPETYEAIQDYLTSRGKVEDTAPLFAGTGNKHKEGRLTTTRISQILKSAMRNAGFDTPRLSAHSTRHSAVTIALQAGHSLDDVQAFARHSSINTTQVYNHSVCRLASTIEYDVARAIFSPVRF